MVCRHGGVDMCWMPCTGRDAHLVLTHLEAFMSMQHVHGVAPYIATQVEDVFLKLGTQTLHGGSQPSNRVCRGAVEDEACTATVRVLKQQQHSLVKVLLCVGVGNVGTTWAVLCHPATAQNHTCDSINISGWAMSRHPCSGAGRLCAQWVVCSESDAAEDVSLATRRALCRGWIMSRNHQPGLVPAKTHQHPRNTYRNSRQSASGPSGGKRAVDPG